MKRVAVVDIGSNTVKLFFYEVKGKKIKKVFSESIYLRLLNHLKNGRLTDEGVEELLLTLRSFKRQVEEFTPDCIFAVATYVLRVAENRNEILEKIREFFDVVLLSGEEEAYYSALGALLDVKADNCLLFDIGGGSLEVCEILEREPKKCKSYPLGTLEFKDAVENGFVKNVRRIRWKVRHHVNPYDFDLYESEILVGVGGSVRALRKVHGKRRIKKKALKSIVEKLLTLKPQEISRLYNIPISRAQTVTVAAVVALELMDIFKCKELIISRYGLREGLIYKKVVLDGQC